LHDKCPDQPEDRDGFQDADGCPDRDNDHDGIPDVKDQCPNDPETFNGYQNADGSPDRSRARSMGYGIYCPLDEAHDQAAWEKNRRVEFKVVKTDKGPTGVPLGCPTAEAKGVKPPP
jgi:hypothetical protein